MSDKLETPQGVCRDGLLAADRDNVDNLDFERIRRLSIAPHKGANYGTALMVCKFHNIIRVTPSGYQDALY